MDKTALYKIGYGLYILTAREGDKDNGCVINTVLQVTSAPSLTGVITVNKSNYTHDMIARSGVFNLSMLTTETPFLVFQHFGFQSGATVDKFAGCEDAPRSANGLIYLPKHINAWLSCEVKELIDFGSHTMFKANIVDGQSVSQVDSVTYAYYQQHIKPRPQAEKKKGYRCTICNYVYEGDVLPADFICPICKHGPSDFVRIE